MDIDSHSEQQARDIHCSKTLISLEVFLISLLIFIPVMYHMIFVFPLTDFGAHGHYIERIYQTHSLIFDGDSVANFLFSILSLILTRLLHIDYRYAELAVLTVNYLALGYLITQRISDRPHYYDPKVIIPCVLALLLYFPIILNPAIDFRHPYGYIPVTSYHNPTVWLAKLFSLWSFFLFLDYFQRGRVPWKIYLLAVVVNLCSLLSKPNYAMCFLPAAGIWIIYSWIKRKPINLKYILLAYFLPMIVTLLWQYWINFIAAPYSTLAFQPLVVAQNLALNGPLTLEAILGALFPLVVLAVYGKPALQHTGIAFGWIQYLIGLAYYYLLTETGPHQFDGNFLWGPEIALFVLVVISAEFWIDRFKQSGTRRRADYIPLIVLIVHGLYGIAYCIHCITL